MTSPTTSRAVWLALYTASVAITATAILIAVYTGITGDWPRGLLIGAGIYLTGVAALAITLIVLAHLGKEHHNA